MLQLKPWSPAVGLTFGVIGIAYLWPAALFAQGRVEPTDKQDSVLEEIIVTGTIIRRPETATASPVSVLTEQELDIRGLNTVADAVTSLPANNAGMMNASWTAFGFAPGASAVSLRGLTVQKTLVVFDGLRMAPYPLGDDGVRNFVDLGTIPDVIVERIEILKDGASSTYGADAIAGVVNVITKEEVTGLHFNGSYGLSQQGDGDEMRGDFTGGWGKLDDDGFNLYATVELQKNEALYFRDRGYPFNTSDFRDVCNDTGVCMENYNSLGLQSDGTIFGAENSIAPLFRPIDPETNEPLGNWQLFDPAAGCPEAYPFLIERSPVNGAEVGVTGPVCELDWYNHSAIANPQIERQGITVRYTQRIGERAEFYAMFNDYRVKTTNPGPRGFNFRGRTSPGGPDVVQVTLRPPYLPVYVCPLGADGYAPCGASNGTLNPNNPFAADGQLAEVLYQGYVPSNNNADIDTESVRYAAGVTGSFGADDLWDYTIEAVSGHVTTDWDHQARTPRRILNVIYNGSFNFVHPEKNTDAILEYVYPSFTTRNTSDMDQVQGTLVRPLLALPGGTLVAAAGLSWRREAINAPNANPAKPDPYERYIGVNTVSANGSRNASAAFFEIDAPIANWMRLNVSGRYDDYSTGQSKFSPKAGLQLQATNWLRLRGTYSQGFRIPSFNEAFGGAITGHIGYTVNPNTDWGQEFLAAHNFNAYASGPKPIGLTGLSNPMLDSEESESYTAGIVLQPVRNLSLTLDYWRIKVNGLIVGPDIGPIIEAYYQNDGVVNLPGITAIPAEPDPDFPDALPLLRYIQYVPINADSEIAEGIDLGVHFGRAIGGADFTSHLEVSHLMELSQTIDGVKLRYEGTLSPCNVTSCSGAPDWRATWVNAIDWKRWTFALTANYTGGYDDASVDFGGVPGDCEASVGRSVGYYPDGSPHRCTHNFYLDWDFSTTFQLSEKVRLYANILNLFDKTPDFDLAPAYGIYGFNPAWELNGIRGRYFRLGMRADF